MTDFFNQLVQLGVPLLLGAVTTIGITLASFSGAIILGLALALIRLLGFRLVNVLISGYVEVLRNTPVLAQLFIIYFSLPSLGIMIDPVPAAIIGLSLNGSAVLSEVFRSGLNAIHYGQREAALAVGMTPMKTFRYIILPQAFRIILPPLLNMLIILLKDTSICSLISTEELMLRAKDLAMMSFLPMHLFLLAGVIYFLLAWPLSIATRHLEKVMQRGRRQTFGT